jgi:hypothetical protein
MMGLSQRAAEGPELRLWTPVALAYAVLLWCTNPFYAIADDEAAILALATTPVSTTLRLIASGHGQHEHPPLYDVLLHGWLEITEYQLSMTRIPAALFTAAGILFCAWAAHLLAGRQAGRWTLVLGVAWPLGFHFGRLAAWYSFCFMLVALLTAAYVRLLQSPNIASLAACSFAGWLLILTNYFGFVLLGVLGLHLVASNSRARVLPWSRLVSAVVLLCTAYGPVWGALFQRANVGVQHGNAPLPALMNLAFSVVTLVISEAVAPWWIPWGVIGVAAVGAALALTVVQVRGVSAVLLAGLLFSLVLMTFTGILFTKRLMFLGPWLLIPMGVAAARATPGRLRTLHQCALAAVQALAVAGIVERQHYSSLRFVEPWHEVAEEQLANLEKGETVVTNNPTLLFEITWVLALRSRLPEESFANALAQVPTRFPSLAVPCKADDALFVPGRTTWWIQGQSEPADLDCQQRAAERMDGLCQRKEEKRLLRDSGYDLKARWFPSAHQIPWRMTIRQYTCHGAS